MAIRFACRCGKKLKVSDDKIGKKVLCPECGSPVRVPESDTVKVETVEPVTGSAGTSSVAGDLLRASSASARRKASVDPETVRAEADREELAEKGKQVALVLLPGVAAIVVISLLVYWISTSVFGSKAQYPPLGAVSGTVTLDNEPLAGATVTFIPRELAEDVAGEWERSRVAESSAITDEEGYYELQYVKGVEGAVPGRHRVRITRPDQETGRESLHHNYNVASKMTRTVEAGSQTFNFDLTTTGDVPTP